MYGRTHRIHLIGIGGSGMSGIAEVLLTMGYQVSGSDLKASETTERIAGLGGRVFIGHAPSNVEGAQVVVFSTAVHADNPEMVAARAAGVPVIARADMLAELMRMKYGVAVGGAHGKTTTTSLIAAVLARGGLDPTIVVGGRLRSLGSNARLGFGRFLVAEADESDGSFLRLSPAVAVVTNIDREHLEHYSGIEEIREAFVQFANRVPFYGAAVLCVDDREVRGILPRVTTRTLLYGLSPDAEVRGVQLSVGPERSHFRVVAQGRDLGAIELHVPGQHNTLNALAAVAVGLELEVGFAHIGEALGGFHGVARRFETRGEAAGVRVVDDYAHHPTEIRATLSVARGLGRRVLAIFQPHRYTRTQALADEFGAAFADADRVWVLDVYAAGEPPLPGVSGAMIVERARQQGMRHVEHAADHAAAVTAVVAEARAGDLVLTLGAGDVWHIGEDVLRGLGRSPTRVGQGT
ncbi:MAG: UDP-N-acetylmuramate--L-alanine ligase [Candidatus Eisenbacteria bacterium]|uniref:UDP-N-acetylmuramate--L-alanine ligase n=1 Tax=Eiseniibacteriota bacterium TaxID=2212470 RepID=A0A538SL30_UNCEI|nr:MAG: UDP-N-acetylmuramate--L-alanine ligase [Candidatus Eisenbacteria bacterium]